MASSSMNIAEPRITVINSNGVNVNLIGSAAQHILAAWVELPTTGLVNVIVNPTLTVYIQTRDNPVSIAYLTMASAYAFRHAAEDEQHEARLSFHVCTGNRQGNTSIFKYQFPALIINTAGTYYYWVEIWLPPNQSDEEQEMTLAVKLPSHHITIQDAPKSSSGTQSSNKEPEGKPPSSKPPSGKSSSSKSSGHKSSGVVASGRVTRSSKKAAKSK
ncbi:hypothetical protein GE09DRAFT_1102083 [Coniochaeta sp. 2T2.1]|nr:hypothetical protein GE09DRAFT_1102083 [Coniochaeta sp. 2T2.1]